MSIKDIVFITEAGRACAADARWTAELAKTLAAGVMGVCQVAAYEPTTAECFAIGADAVSAVYSEMDERTRALIARSREGFSSGVADLGVVTGWRESLTGEAVESIARGVRSFDLAIVPDYGTASRRLAELVILEAGTPCLILPERMSAWAPFQRVMVGWNGSRQARRALDAALPILRAAKEVRLVTVGAGSLPATELDRDWGILAHLRRHGVAADLHQIRNAAIEPEKALLDHTKAFGADLVVMGAYGHARTAEIMFGGVTRSFLNGCPLPLLLSQ